MRSVTKCSGKSRGNSTSAAANASIMSKKVLIFEYNPLITSDHVAVITRLFVSSILNSRNVVAKLLAKDALLTSTFFDGLGYLKKLNSRKEKPLPLPLRGSVLIRRPLFKNSVTKRLFSFW